jgi:hypothetical protein
VNLVRKKFPKIVAVQAEMTVRLTREERRQLATLLRKIGDPPTRSPGVAALRRTAAR